MPSKRFWSKKWIWAIIIVLSIVCVWRIIDWVKDRDLLPENTPAVLVSHLAFSPDGRLLACSGARDRRPAIAIVEVATKHTVASLDPGHTWSLRFSADGEELTSWGKRIVRSWSTRSWKQIWHYDIHGDRGPVQLSPDERTLAVPGYNKSTGKHNVAVWDIREDKELFSFSHEGEKSFGVDCLAFSHDAKLLAAAFGGSSVRLVSLDTKKVVLEFQPLAGGDLDPVGVSDLEFSLNDRFLAVSEESDKSISIWDVVQRERRISLKGHWPAQQVKTMAFSPNGKMLASGSGIDAETGELRVWNLGDEKPIFTRSIGAPVAALLFRQTESCSLMASRVQKTGALN